MKRSRISSKSASQLAGVYCGERARQIRSNGAGAVYWRHGSAPKRHARFQPGRFAGRTEDQVFELATGAECGELDVVGVVATSFHHQAEDVAGAVAVVVSVVDVVERGQPAAADGEDQVVAVLQVFAGIAAVLGGAEQQLGHQVHVAGIAEPDVGVRVDVREVKRRPQKAGIDGIAPASEQFTVVLDHEPRQSTRQAAALV